MPAVSRALLVAVALCVFQTSQADDVPTFDDLLKTVQLLQQNTKATLDDVAANITSAVDAKENLLIANLTATVSATEDQVDTLLAAAKAEGIDATSCGSDATTSLTNIAEAFPSSLYHCQVDNLDVYNYYVQNVDTDFSLIYQAVKEGNQEISACSLLDVSCAWTAYYNVTKFELTKEADIAFQVLNAQTASVNLIATINVCDEEKSTQATLDTAKVVPQTVDCIKQKKEEASTTTSSN